LSKLTEYKSEREHLLGVVVHTCNPGTWEAEADGWSVQGQPGLHSEFEAKQGYTASPYLKNKQKGTFLLYVNFA
jgi:hypothetical protein